MMIKAEIGVKWYYTSRGTPSIEAKKRQEEIIPQSLQEEHGPADTLLLTCSHKNCEEIFFGCFKTFILWRFLKGALGNEYKLHCKHKI